jgi:hypothetical protein
MNTLALQEMLQGLLQGAAAKMRMFLNPV